MLGYPNWVWRLRLGGDMGLSSTILKKLRKNAVDIDKGGLEPLQEVSARHKITVVVIGPDGALLNRHRKLLETNSERMVWGHGNASGLQVVDTPVGRIGTLLC